MLVKKPYFSNISITTKISHYLDNPFITSNRRDIFEAIFSKKKIRYFYKEKNMKCPNYQPCYRNTSTHPCNNFLHPLKIQARRKHPLNVL